MARLPSALSIQECLGLCYCYYGSHAHWCEVDAELHAEQLARCVSSAFGLCTASTGSEID